MAKEGMEKLIAAGKSLIEGEITVSPTESGPSRPDPIGDFTSHDLIRSNIADPRSFDEAAPPNEENDNILIANAGKDEVLVVSKDQNPASVDNVNSRWSFSFNPLNYLQRQDSEPNRGVEANDDANADANAGQIESLDAGVSLEEPQLASTPND